MSTVSIEMICPCTFTDKNGEKVDYTRVLVCTRNDRGVFWTLEKACNSIVDSKLSFGCPVRLFYDRNGRICSVE